jgi:polar amino acid transport system substrate-binding protein
MIMKKTVSYGVLILLLSIFSSCSHHSGTYVLTSPAPVLDRIQSRGELIVGTAADMPPFNMTTKDNRIIGLEVDLAQALAQAMEVELKLQAISFKDLLPALEAGKVDMILSGMTITAKRNSKVAFVGPYYISGKGLLTKTSKLADIKDPDEIDRSEVRITALEGSTSEVFVKNILPNVKFLAARNYTEAVIMVINDKADAMIADQPICVVSVARYPDEDLFAILTPFTFEPIGIALPANDPLLVNLVQNFLNAIEDSGALDLMLDKWFQEGEWWNQLK